MLLKEYNVIIEGFSGDIYNSIIVDTEQISFCFGAVLSPFHSSYYAICLLYFLFYLIMNNFYLIISEFKKTTTRTLTIIR